MCGVRFWIYERERTDKLEAGINSEGRDGAAYVF